MSVWESTTYKLDIARSLFETVPDLAKVILGPSPSCYLQPKGDLVPFDHESSWDDVAEACSWEMYDMTPDAKREVIELTKRAKSWSVGISAVYKLVDACYKRQFDVTAQYNYANIETKVRVLGGLVSASSMVTPRSFMEKWEQGDDHMIALARIFEDFSEAWKYLTRSVRLENEEFELFDQDAIFGEGARIYYGGYIRKVVILVGSGPFSERGLLLTRTHLNVLVEATARIGSLLDHTAREHSENRMLRERILRILDMTIKDASSARDFNVDKVVQGYHKARAYMQMILFSNVMTNSEEEALLEFQAKGLQNVIDLDSYCAAFRGVEKARWLELLHVYKWMPPPDFDSSYAFSELQELHTSTRKSGLDSDASNQMRSLWLLIEKERKLNIARAYRRLNGDWPRGLEVHNDSPTEEGIDTWVPSALFPYYTYGKDVTGQIKDKTTILARMEDELATEPNVHDKNFLLWFINHRDEIDTVRHGDEVSRGFLPEDNYVRVAYKGEAHKPGSRLFFMAPPLQRILLGELEGNISRVASVYPASLQGMDALKRADALEQVFDVYDRKYVPESLDEYTCYVITFDLSKFSPRFNPRVLANLHAFWAQVFSYPPILSMRAIGADSTILHTTNNLVMHYKNQGADLEGFRGRMMTLFHADMIAAACRLSVQRGHTIGHAKTAVFIDDGAVRIAALGTGEVAKGNALAFLVCMKDVYEAAGQENHPNKTIVSCIGGELLAEQYLHGQRLKCPIKAGMRLFPNYENPAACITEEFDSLFATIQGSIRDGCQWVVAYRRYTEAYVKSIYRWERKEVPSIDAISFAFKVITPKSLGGFGLPPLQALASTTSYDLTVEGLGMLNAIGKVAPQYEERIIGILNRRVIIREPLHVLRDPGRIRLEGPILIEGRLVDRIIDQLSTFSGPCAQLVMAYKSPDIRAHATAIAEAMQEGDAISLPVMKRVWESTPLAYLEGILQKFKRATSIRIVLGERGITSVRRANQKDVRKVLRFRPDLV